MRPRFIELVVAMAGTTIALTERALGLRSDPRDAFFSHLVHFLRAVSATAS